MTDPKAAESFRAMHERTDPEDPLVIPNVWDAGSARAFAERGFPVLATSSGAVAATLGYEDGGRTPADEMFAAIARIARAVDVPVTADIEAGYGLEPREIVDRLLEAGVVGCNLEDSEPLTGELRDVDEHASWLAEVSVAAGDRLVLNARVDTFLYGDRSVESAVRRARRYIEAGADVIFPILAPVELLPDIAECVTRPVNALCLPGGPRPAELGKLGAARVTFGHTLYTRAMEGVRGLAGEL
ncbi:isocitrate lyase/phosphoenolpyruvate mutase family protein [Streptomyces sp. AM 4-1-1]|uniref:isocitrate lyase/PEP mutase family protein n=1 Tax=Streptomyces sp. AM 4-1-1 TaxID=3028710 RepID=UPI0023BA2107|nr:isocitrate lyase/phosphoenolpyruvate mutase family protein [Streptomyces sp. AM 4-1-1]WEH34925.1 isocitrate lyase/phosphoenolpyruvate mutase family protein [Streptomyces sp. AM 4-1-1]